MAFKQLPGWDIQEEVEYELTVEQPAVLRSREYLMAGFQLLSNESLLVALKDDNGRFKWYDAFKGIWTGEASYIHGEKYDALINEHPQWVRLVRSFVEEKLDPDEIRKAEKLGEFCYKLTHRYTGGWWLEELEEPPDLLEYLEKSEE